jgi:hypothetical protein
MPLNALPIPVACARSVIKLIAAKFMIVSLNRCQSYRQGGTPPRALAPPQGGSMWRSLHPRSPGGQLFAPHGLGGILDDRSISQLVPSHRYKSITPTVPRRFRSHFILIRNNVFIFPSIGLVSNVRLLPVPLRGLGLETGTRKSDDRGNPSLSVRAESIRPYRSDRGGARAPSWSGQRSLVADTPDAVNTLFKAQIRLFRRR